MSITLHPAPTKYADYGTEIREDHGNCIIEPDSNGALVKYHYRISRIPSQKLFILRHCKDSTPEDREKAERSLAAMPEGHWADFPSDRWFKRRSTRGFFFWTAYIGRYLDDPLIDLELEMMIDLTTSEVAPVTALRGLNH